MIIDCNKTYTPKRILRKGDISTDHFSIIIIFKDLPRATKITKKEEIVIWDTKKPGGWKKYEELMENCADFDEILEDPTVGSTEAFARITKIQESIKYKAFGKVKFKKGQVDDELKQIYAERSKII